MSSSELLTDAYLIELLQRDAQRKSTRRIDAPKPNTRFLRNIVRDVDSHNSALKAREEAEARARQRRLKREEKPGRSREGEEHERRKRRRRREEEEDVDGRRERHRKHRRDRERSRSRSPRQRKDGDRNDRERERSRRERPSAGARSKSPSRSPRRSSQRHRHSRPERSSQHGSSSIRHDTRRRRSPSAASSSSDPLDEVLGPQPLPANHPLPRGRGAFKPQTSSIETRFRESYDPKTDVREDEENGAEDDWDRGLEAVRDRAKWRQNGAERLRAAGFTEQEVQNWERGPASGGEEAMREKDVRDVRWLKKGEGIREWDRGKGEDGKADWIGRLT